MPKISSIAEKIPANYNLKILAIIASF